MGTGAYGSADSAGDTVERRGASGGKGTPAGVPPMLQKSSAGAAAGGGAKAGGGA